MQSAPADNGLDPLVGIVRGHVELYVRYRLEARGNLDRHATHILTAYVAGS